MTKEVIIIFSKILDIQKSSNNFTHFLVKLILRNTLYNIQIQTTTICSFQFHPIGGACGEISYCRHQRHLLEKNENSKRFSTYHSYPIPQKVVFMNRSVSSSIKKVSKSF